MSYDRQSGHLLAFSIKYVFAYLNCTLVLIISALTLAPSIYLALGFLSIIAYASNVVFDSLYYIFLPHSKHGYTVKMMHERNYLRTRSTVVTATGSSMAGCGTSCRVDC